VATGLEHGRQLLGVDVRIDDLGSEPARLLRHQATEPASGPGDDDDLALEMVLHEPLPYYSCLLASKVGAGVAGDPETHKDDAIWELMYFAHARNQ
jgi:hypothetical protein